MKRIVRVSHVTQGFLYELTEEQQKLAVEEFHVLAKQREDWFYGVLRDPVTNHPLVFIEQNETGAYTALMNHEH